MAEPARRGVYLKLVLMAFFWGATFIGGRVAVAEFAPTAAALWRYGLAAVALVIAVHALEGGLPRLAAREWRAVLALGLTGVLIFSLCFMFGLARVPASRGSLIMALSPAFTLFGAALFFGEPLGRNKVLGVLVALAGVVVVLGRGDPFHLVSGGVGIGEILLFGCPLSWSVYTLGARRWLPGRSALAVTTYATIAGTVMLALVTAGSGDLVPPSASWKAWLAIGFIGIFGTALAFVWFYEGVRAIGPARTAVFMNLVPVFAIALGVLVLGEPLEVSMLIGGAIVIAGILLLNRPDRAAPRIAPVSAE